LKADPLSSQIKPDQIRKRTNGGGITFAFDKHQAANRRGLSHENCEV
jgi:hypothetical protein